MASATAQLSADYWQNLQVTAKDIEFLQTYLFEHEIPLTPHELAQVLIAEHIRFERERVSGIIATEIPYFPRNQYSVGDQINFLSLNANGRVDAVRAGFNPELGLFEVLTIKFEDGRQKLFAAGLESHALNHLPAGNDTSQGLDLETVVRDFGAALELRLDAAFAKDDGLVRIAGRWFPRSLLMDVNTGQLNLAEALLDMSAGEPLPTDSLMKDIELPVGVNAKLAEFSLNYALQEDARFDEVGPAGEVLWCLHRLEPDGVQNTPVPLRYIEIEHNRAALSDKMLDLEAQVDDELSDEPDAAVDEVTISLLYPHWRAGTLPVSGRTARLFPTAYESPRVRFTLVDVKNGKKIPAWVVRTQGYVYGLEEWYKSQDMIPGGLIRLRPGDQPGEVRVEALTRRPVRDWVRTVIVGADGGLVFALLKQQVSVELNERMAIAVPDAGAVDAARELASKNHQLFKDLTINLMRELMKLSPQGHVHVQELYAAINILRRVPPAPLMALLAQQPEFNHVGDLHFRLED